MFIFFVDQEKPIEKFFREIPVDLLIYDQRSSKINPVHYLNKLEREIKKLVQNWGCDFQFSNQRMIVILDQNKDIANITFELGNKNIRDILVSPPSFFKVLRWVARLLTSDLKKISLKLVWLLVEGSRRLSLSTRVCLCY